MHPHCIVTTPPPPPPPQTRVALNKAVADLVSVGTQRNNKIIINVIMILLLCRVPSGVICCHLLQRKPLVSNPCMHPGTCRTHVPGCMPRSLTCGGGENVLCILSACATRNFAYLVRGPCNCDWSQCCQRFVKWWYYFATDQRLVVRHVTALWNVSPVLIP